jgi:DNA topoisomerase-1
MEQAVALLAERAAKGGSGGKRKPARAAKAKAEPKAGAKKAPAKKKPAARKKPAPKA